MPSLLQWFEQRMKASAQTAGAVLPRLRQALSRASLTIPDDLEVLENGLVYSNEQDQVEYLWFHVIEREGGQTFDEYRVIRLLHLDAIPLNARGDQGALSKMRTVLRGLYNAKVDVAYLVAGIYHPERLGIVQCYGTVGRSHTLDEAVSQALHGGASLEAGMAAAYPQIRFRPLSARLGDWISQALMDMPHGILAELVKRVHVKGGL